jgi:hypothetical protein
VEERFSWLENKIFEVDDAASFEHVSLDVFDFQYTHCEVYRRFVDTLNRPKPRCLLEIPFLPISFFKSHEVRAGLHPVQHTFLSSGTGQEGRSKHFVERVDLYERSFFKTYKQQIGDPESHVILALLPNYVEQGNSSLVYMVESLIQTSKHPLSGFYLTKYQDLKKAYQLALETKKKIVLFGVSYALLDLAEEGLDFSQALVIETGGMKGKRKELSKEELHHALKKGLRLSHVASEYGMTELFSQAYSLENELFTFPAWMQVLIRETNDPFEYVSAGKTGGVNVIDLANLYSCSFIATQDLGQIHGEQLKLMGRFDHADVRGCNLLLE